jgi:hypothetical protein
MSEVINLFAVPWAVADKEGVEVVVVVVLRSD